MNFKLWGKPKNLELHIGNFRIDSLNGLEKIIPNLSYEQIQEITAIFGKSFGEHYAKEMFRLMDGKKEQNRKEFLKQNPESRLVDALFIYDAAIVRLYQGDYFRDLDNPKNHFYRSNKKNFQDFLKKMESEYSFSYEPQEQSYYNRNAVGIIFKDKQQNEKQICEALGTNKYHFLQNNKIRYMLMDGNSVLNENCKTKFMIYKPECGIKFCANLQTNIGTRNRENSTEKEYLTGRSDHCEYIDGSEESENNIILDYVIIKEIT